MQKVRVYRRQGRTHEAGAVAYDPLDRVPVLEHPVDRRPGDAGFLGELGNGADPLCCKGGGESSVGLSGLEVGGNWGRVALGDGDDPCDRCRQAIGFSELRRAIQSCHSLVTPQLPSLCCQKINNFLLNECRHTHSSLRGDPSIASLRPRGPSSMDFVHLHCTATGNQTIVSG